MRLPKLGIRPPMALVTSLVTAVTIAGCADTGPVAPNRELIDAVGSATLAKGTATGVYQIVARESQGPTGELRLDFTETSHGTATGADGSRYRFSYAANYTLVDPEAFPVTLDLVDHFNLLGQGGAPDVKVYLRGQFLFDGSLPLEPVGNPVIRGGIACDPI